MQKYYLSVKTSFCITKKIHDFVKELLCNHFVKYKKQDPDIEAEVLMRLRVCVFRRKREREGEEGGSV